VVYYSNPPDTCISAEGRVKVDLRCGGGFGGRDQKAPSLQLVPIGDMATSTCSMVLHTNFQNLIFLGSEKIGGV
jgi:hypothetical protein